MSRDDERGQEYECERCGLRALVSLAGGGAVTPLVVCPACGARARLAGVESLARVVACGLGGIFVAGEIALFSMLVLTAGFAAGGLLGAVLELGSWRQGRHARVVRQLRAPRQLGLPEAYVRKRPRDE